MRWLARAITVSPASSGWRSASSTCGGELRQLVEEQHAEMRQARPRRAAARVPPPTSAAMLAE